MTSDTNNDTGIVPEYIEDALKHKKLLDKEDRHPATEQEENDFEEYQKEIDKQQPIIQSYEDLLAKKELDEKKEELKKLNNKIGERYINLHSQQYKDPGATDRLGKRADYYLEVKEQVDDNTLFDGDIDKQLRLLRLLASQQSEITGAEQLVVELDRFETELRHEARQKQS